jgi:hypothetical protein
MFGGVNENFVTAAVEVALVMAGDSVCLNALQSVATEIGVDILPAEHDVRRVAWPSEPRHSPDKATPSYYTKNESFASGISKVWCVCVDFRHEGGIYRGEWDLHRLGKVGLVPGGGRAGKPHGRPAEWSGFHRLSPPTRASPPHVDVCQPSFGLNHLKP